jgi:hypothetical protein
VNQPPVTVTGARVAAVVAVTSVLQLFVLPYLSGWPVPVRLLLSARSWWSCWATCERRR